tara:strand:- start:473 stop:1765 length:1293 start_codon:yes stop_codon:yes gene_type:complete
MPKRKLGIEIKRSGRLDNENDVVIPVASDLLKVEGIPTRDAEVSYYSREFPLESFAVTESASAIWSEKERNKVSPETSRLYKAYQDEIMPWVQKIRDVSTKLPTSQKVSSNITELVKDKAKELGYGEVGFTKFDRRYIYSSRKDEVKRDLPNAICLAYEQDFVRTQTIPSLDAERAQGDAYLEQAKLSLKLSEFLLSIGYRSQISGPVWHFGPLIPMFVQSGLGQLGVNGQLLSPHFGSRARLQILITDAPLEHDVPIDYGIYKLCETCQICFMRCPGKAIQAQRVWYRGVEKNKLIHRRCRPVMTRYSGCGICIKVCPVQKYGMAEVMNHYLETGEILGKGTENLEGYEIPGKGYFPPGKVPAFDREFFDMPTGSEEEIALSDFNNAMDLSSDLTDNEKEEIWREFQNRLMNDREKKTTIVDMGMDINI